MSQPSLECDLVMKGGVTSGIIYPSAIAAIAERYRLRSVGGTSAGAIGAAAAAAMEFGRRSGRNAQAREELDQLASKLGAETNGQPLLFRLFAPDAKTSRLFSTILRMSKSGGIFGVGLAIIGPSLLTAFLLISLLAAVVLWRINEVTLLSGGIAIVAALSLTILLGIVLALARWAIFAFRGAKAVAGNNFGFCSGMAKASATDDSLTQWIHGQLQSLAGLGPAEPLTYGDLWAAQYRTGSLDRDKAFATALRAAKIAIPEVGDMPIHLLPRDIELALVTSDISRAQTVQLPFMRREDRLFAYLPDLEALFPEDVVTWLKTHARQVKKGYDDLSGMDLGDLDPDQMIRLPRPQNMPVIVGVRMSLSFPLLFSAVRLYLMRGYGEASNKELVELWFADGGITSNFPLHLFDSPIPNRPTFCLNLLYHDDELEVEIGPVDQAETGAPSGGREGLAPASAPDQDLVFMLRDNNGRLSPYTRFAQGDPIARLMRFGGRVISTARQWGDNQLLDVPGYRDRIVHVRMKDKEGGFNLDMDKDTIKSLQTRGTRAGSVIAERFLPTSQLDPAYPGQPLILNWANHRFVRLRAFLGGLETTASRFDGAWKIDLERAALEDNNPEKIGPSLKDLIHKKPETLSQKAGYPFAASQKKLADEMVAAVQDLHGLTPDPAENGIDYVQGSAKGPKPKQGLKLRPATDSDIRNEQP